jgi:hypothetical protein
VELRHADLAANYREVLTSCEPFLISFPGNYGALDLAPYGVAIAEERLYTATTLRSREVVDGLHRLDAATFGDQDMLMPRWVLFDCGEFPGIVFGFGRRAALLSAKARAHYQVEGKDKDETFVPLSMWVAIRCAEEGAWFGHNLSSANVVMDKSESIAGLATITKIVGVKLTRATKQYGATQWDSGSIGLHLRLGDMHLHSAFTPAHTHPETLSYRIDVDDAILTRSLMAGYRAPRASGQRTLAADERAGIEKLQEDLERGEAWKLVRAERREGKPQLCHLERG